MKRISKKTKIGIGLVVLLMLVLVPVYLFFYHESTGAQLTSVNKMSKGIQTENTEEVDKRTSEKIDSSEEEQKGSESKEQSNIVSSDKPHKEFLVVIDPGHQEKPNLEKEPVGPGASESKIKVSGGTAGVVTRKPEYKLTLEASLILGKLLEDRGVKVIYTRTTHQINISNVERAEIANQKHGDLFVRIHADGSADQNVRGLSVQTPGQSDPYTKAIFEDSLKASQFIIAETKKNAALKVNGIFYRSDLSGFNWSKVPTTLVEMGYMTNPEEDRSLSEPTYLTKLMTNIADGILDYAQTKGN